MKRFCLILILLLILAVICAGCTDEKPQDTVSPAVPTDKVPAGTEQVVPSAGDPQTTAALTTEVPFSGMEIEDSHVETVGENVGIGGN